MECNVKGLGFRGRGGSAREWHVVFGAGIRGRVYCLGLLVQASEFRLDC